MRVDERSRLRQELVLRVLGWGAVVFFLVTGFALDQHALFELFPPPGASQLQAAQTAYAAALDGQSAQARQSDPVAAASLAAEAAKIRAEVDSAVKDQSDSRGRAMMLIVGALTYAVVYPLLIMATYRRTDPDGTLAAGDLIPRRTALIFGITMSVVTAVVAVSTAYE
jgi:hypothetical protein